MNQKSIQFVYPLSFHHECWRTGRKWNRSPHS